MGRGRLRLQQCQRGQPRRGAANHRSGHRWHLSVASQPREAHISGARGFFAAAEMVHQGCTKHTPATEWQLWGAVPALEDHRAVPTPLAMIDDLSCSCHAQAPSNSPQLYATGAARVCDYSLSPPAHWPNECNILPAAAFLPRSLGRYSSGAGWRRGQAATGPPSRPGPRPVTGRHNRRAAARGTRCAFSHEAIAGDFSAGRCLDAGSTPSRSWAED